MPWRSIWDTASKKAGSTIRDRGNSQPRKLHLVGLRGVVSGDLIGMPYVYVWCTPNEEEREE